MIALIHFFCFHLLILTPRRASYEFDTDPLTDTRRITEMRT